MNRERTIGTVWACLARGGRHSRGRTTLVIVSVWIVISPLAAFPAAAADVSRTVVAYDGTWRLGSESGAASPTITVNVGDTLHLQVENRDTMKHALELARWDIRVIVYEEEVKTVDIAPTSDDIGKWQFQDRDYNGMVGWIEVKRAPLLPGFEAVAALGAVAVAFLAVAVWSRRRHGT